MLRRITVALALLALPGCPTKKPDAVGDDVRAVLKALGEDVIVPTLEGFAADAQALAEATGALAAARASGPAQAELETARRRFAAAFGRWQLAEVMQLGPAGAPGKMTGGQGLRDGIYAWPVVNDCRVDTHLVERAWEAPGFFDTALVTSMGLTTVERLLYVDGPDNACAPTAPINADGRWAALSADELALRRARYAEATAKDIAARARALAEAWRGGFLQTLAGAGTPGSGFRSAQEALDQTFAALFYVDWIVKDDKLANPMGSGPACHSGPCPELAEARASGLSREAIAANLDAAKAMLHGSFTGAGRGFDALLAARGAQALADDMSRAADEAKAAVLALPGPIDEAVRSEPAAVTGAYTKVKAFTDLLKTRFVTVLSLRVPQEGAGDND